jgi:hypothetical protein
MQKELEISMQQISEICSRELKMLCSKQNNMLIYNNVVTMFLYFQLNSCT